MISRSRLSIYWKVIYMVVNFTQFATISIDDVNAFMKWLPDKQAFCDALPVPVLKQVAVEIAPFLVSLYNNSLSTGVFTDRYIYNAGHQKGQTNFFWHSFLSTRDVLDSGWPVLPSDNCVTGEYRYWPVLGCRFRYSANGHCRPTVAGGNTSSIWRLCVLKLEPD